MNHRYAPPPPETLPPLPERILALRRKQWSDKAIARYLDVPIDTVRLVLGIATPEQVAASYHAGVRANAQTRDDTAAEADAAVPKPTAARTTGHVSGSAPTPAASRNKDAARVDVAEAVRLRRQGARQSEIARVFGVTPSAVSQALKRSEAAE